MTNESLHRIIDRANGTAGPEIIITRPLTDTVVWARVWLDAPNPERTDARQYGHKVYLIRNEHFYVGIVLDHGAKDLHSYVHVPPQHRGKHYMSTALREVILPHLLQDARRFQRITISRNYGRKAFKAAERVALAAGFVPLQLQEDEEENIATLQFTPNQSVVLPVFLGQNSEPAPDYLNRVSKQLAYHAACLQLLSEEVAMHLGDDFLPEYIDDLASEVHGLGLKVEDAIWKMRRRTVAQ